MSAKIVKIGSKSITVREIKREECLIEFEPLEEHVDPQGCFATDDPEADRAMVAEILNRIEDGDIFGWFCAKVTVTFGPLQATDYLGCCSYKDEAEFKEPGGYYDSMVDECLGQIQAQIEALLIKLG